MTKPKEEEDEKIEKLKNYLLREGDLDLWVALVYAKISKQDKNIILVIDDYHLIQEAAVHQIVNDLLRFPPHSLQLVLMTRRAPPLDLQMLRARGRMVELRMQDLRFTPEEIAAFVRRIWDTETDDETLRLLDKNTEGWAAGLRFFFLSAGGS